MRRVDFKLVLNTDSELDYSLLYVMTDIGSFSSGYRTRSEIGDSSSD